ncbi:hypothetical protein [Leucothrix arctica]|uniref:Uncharacterized protein n=1 Tax=Leucothrix arctica TaxID=1481894 RepID=A0A317C778_9GAMM|nr:hypothetical protein [Leucothrix arctica]PWQ94494.1 hypothetical protein DKT75_14440 [Leucothrix arctica]
MKLHIPQVALLISLLGASLPAHATSSAYADFYIPYKQVQSDYTCLNRQTMEAVFGIPLASIVKGVFAETRTYHQSMVGPGTYQNINLLANETTVLDPVLNFDRFNESEVFDYSFTLDLVALNTENGGSGAGRQKTIDTAKLAIIAIIKTAELTHKEGKFRVWINFENLPLANNLAGSVVHSGGTDWPSWPYTASSPVYQQYLSEAIHEDC